MLKNEPKIGMGALYHIEEGKNFVKSKLERSFRKSQKYFTELSEYRKATFILCNNSCNSKI